MAADGSQPVAWASSGSAFSHLLHHQAGSTAPGQQFSPAAAPKPQTAAGVWDGPAPRGTRTAATASQAATTCKTYLSLPQGGRLPLLGLGTYKVDSADSVRQAVELGYRHLDCAECYENQQIIGEGISKFIKDGRRQELFIVSKIWNDRHRPEEVRKSAEETIRDLGCGSLDLLLIHWPITLKPGTTEPDNSVTLLQTWRAMEALVKDGLTKYIGVSNFTLKQVQDLCQHAEIKPVCNQVELHPQLPQRKLVGGCLRQGVYCVAYAPLGYPPNKVEGQGPTLEEPVIQALAKETGRTPAQVVLKWNIQRGVSVIPKAQTPKNFTSNFEGLFDWTLTEEQKGRLDALEVGKRKCLLEGHSFDPDHEVSIQ